MPTHAQQQNASQQNTSSKAAPESAGMQLEQDFAEILDLQQTAGNHAVQRLLSDPYETDSPIRSRMSQPAVMRDEDDPVRMTELNVNQQLVTTPPVSGLSLAAQPVPANATDVTYDLEDGSATVDGGTNISDTGAITLSANQHGGTITAVADQEIQVGDSILTSHQTEPVNMAAVARGISSTTSSPAGSGNVYGGLFWHTFNSPGGGQAALHHTTVNEHFPAASGTTLNLTGGLGSVRVTVNAANAAGWELDTSGTMIEPDNVDWGTGESAAPLIARASNPTPANPLPQELTATQQFRNKEFPNGTYGTDTVATAVHRRAYEERDGEIVAVTSVNGEELVETYRGATVFRNASAASTTLEAGSDAETQISVEVVGIDQAPQYWIEGEDHGCNVNQTTGVFTVGSEAGEVVVHAGRTGNYDAVTITITAPPGEESTETGEEESVETVAPGE